MQTLVLMEIARSTLWNPQAAPIQMAREPQCEPIKRIVLDGAFSAMHAEHLVSLFYANVKNSCLGS